MAAASRAGDGTLHRRIITDIEERILSGAWRPGDRIPAEHTLAERYGCSRMTVNKALTQLARAGYIERRRRAGSFVRQPQAQSAVLEIHTVESEISALGLPYTYAWLEQRERRAGPDAARMEADPDAPLLEVRCLHRAGGEPFCLEERLIGLGAVPGARDADFRNEPPSAWLVRQVPWRIAEHIIGAEAASPEAARRLGLTEADACLVVERRTWDAAGVVTWVRLTYPAGRHRLVARFAPTDV